MTIDMTEEEYRESVYKEKSTVPSWIFDVVTFDYANDQKYYVGLEYNRSWPEDNWFYVLMKVYADKNDGAPSLYHNVQMFSGYRNKRRANEEERQMLIKELYKKNWKVVRVDDNGFVEYKIEKSENEV